MQISMTPDMLEAILDALEIQHKELMENGTKWSSDLEGDFAVYSMYRQKEFNLAGIINNLKKQRSWFNEKSQETSKESDSPMRGPLPNESVPKDFKEFLLRADVLDPEAMNEAVAQGWLPSTWALKWTHSSVKGRQDFVKEWTGKDA